MRPEGRAAPKGATDVVAALAEWFPSLVTDRAAFQAAAAEPLRVEELGQQVHRVSPAAAVGSSDAAAAPGDVVIYRTALAGASDYVKVGQLPASTHSIQHSIQHFAGLYICTVSQ